MNIDSFLKTDKSIDVYGKDEFNLFHNHVPHLHKMYIERVVSAWSLFSQLNLSPTPQANLQLI